MNFKNLESGGSGGAKAEDFIKLKGGQAIEGVLRGEPIDYYMHWVAKRPVLCSGRNTCVICSPEEKGNFRFQINLVVSEGGKWVPKIWENSRTVYMQLAALQEAGYELETTKIRVSRQGDGTDTAYTILPSPKPLTAPDLKALSEVKLHELTPPPLPGAGNKAEATETVDDIPF